MKKSFAASVVFVGAVLVPAFSLAQAPGPSPEPAKVDIGKREFDSKCAVCHGMTGKGDGPYKVVLQNIPDLTTLAKKNGGVFPFQKAYDIIDGRTELKAHGTREMPIWGTEYRFDAKHARLEVPYMAPEAYVRARILALNEYLYRLQAK